MAGQSWSIDIVPSGNTISLNPDVFGAQPGTPLQAQVGDLVSWNNQTDNTQTVSVSGETLVAATFKSTTAYQIQNPNKNLKTYTITYTVTGKQGTQNGLITVLL
ncbi:MAG: hypothetical protein ACRD3J_03420 [Thermoanaerobaculia bacterium]